MDFSIMENQMKRLKFPCFEPVVLLIAFFLPPLLLPTRSGQECLLFVYPPCRHTLPCCVMGGWSSWTMDEDIPLGMKGDKLQHSWVSVEQTFLSTTRHWGNIHFFRPVRGLTQNIWLGVCLASGWEETCSNIVWRHFSDDWGCLCSPAAAQLPFGHSVALSGVCRVK